MSDRPDLVLHVGMPQSGESTLQSALSQLRPQLRRHGVGYLGHAQIAAAENVAGWAARPRPSKSASVDFEHELAAMVATERRTVRARRPSAQPATVLLSSEQFLGTDNIGACDTPTFRPCAVAGLTQVIRALRPERTRLVLYIQRQDRLMDLCYIREVMAGRSHAFAEQFPKRFRPVLDYRELIGRIAAVPGIDDVVVKPVEPLAAGAGPFVDDFLDVVGLRGSLDLSVIGSVGPQRLYSTRGTRVALGMNPHLETPAERKRVRGMVLSNFAAQEDSDTYFVHERPRARIVAAYRETNRQLFRTYLPRLPEASYADDAGTEQLRALLSQWVPPRRPGRAALLVMRRAARRARTVGTEFAARLKQRRAVSGRARQ